MAYNINKIRSYFPVLNQQVYNKPMVYLDSAASAQKPVQVLMKEEKLHNDYYGNIHRAAHFMADKATADFEAVRDKIQKFINAESREEIIFTKGTTESINLVAHSFGEKFLTEGDEIIVSEMEHHSNIVPWQIVAERKGAKVIKFPFNDLGVLQLNLLPKLINKKTKLIAVAHVSNVLGTINPVSEIIEIAHKNNVAVCIDGAQAVQHTTVDVQKLDADFYAFSAHKMYGPNGVGVLYGKKKWLEKMPPYQGGGEMISEVSFEKTTFNEIPYKFEAGTPNITSVIAFGAAVDLLIKAGISEIAAWENELLEYATQKLKLINGLKIYGEAPKKSSVISFNIEGIHSYDLGMLLDKLGIAVRTGHHCADTVMQHFGIQGTVRISFGIYTTKEEIDIFLEALNKVILMF
ncbi:MAG: cysteine desulfurase [Prolixibacteraceae bacterium]|jgi:cysteine desulfurase / selenocysteine lyase|nr:cysteine desulfurase [Prolixibacteraceae bacterium]MBT6767213.1 cysteine desulfurase [Prolixibacteraceae bacterium]MBT6997510.1 cysteine desulfurase [Prolixibacteraceae bacterium]MBT7394596.1 cysteine desulfurase [Prolixibacteraceae bacterium]